MKAFLLVTFLPLLLLAALLSFGTRRGTDWEKNLRSEAETTGADEWLSSLSPQESKLLQDFRGEWGKHGLMLQPGMSGFASFALSKAPAADSLMVRVWAYDYGACSVKWWPKERPGSPVTLSGEESLNGKVYRIEIPAATSRIILEVSGRNDTAQPQVLVRRIAVSSSPFKPVKEWIAAFWCWGILTALWLGLAAKRKWWSPPGGIKLWYAALLLLLVGGSLRLNLLSFQNGVRLDPDVIMYQMFAERLQWFDAGRGFYSASFSEREPLWIAMLKLWQGWVGAGPLSARLLTCFLSVSVIAFSGILLWRFIGKRSWVIAGIALVALNPALVEESCRGLRSEAMTLGFIGFLLLTFNETESRFSPVKAGLLGGTWALVQSPALGVVFGTWLVLWFMNFVEKRASIRLIIPKGYSLPKVLLAMAVSLALFIPHLYGLQKQHGDWRWPSYGYARWNANVEFPERLGTPGFPTVEEFKKSPYAGPRISYGEYLFGLHTPFQLVKYQILGWVELTAYQVLSFSTQSLKRLMFAVSSGSFSAVVMSIGPALALGFLLGIVSLVAWFRLLLDKRLWWMPLMLLWGTYYVAFLYHVRLVEPLRHTMHTYPLLILIMTWGAQWLWHRSRISEFMKYVRTRRLQQQETV
jgi:hypothetical protein